MNLVLLGLLLVIIGIVACIVGMLVFFIEAARRGEGEKKVEGGGLILIGPFPIVFGSSTKITRMMIILAIVLIVVFLILSLLPFLLW